MVYNARATIHCVNYLLQVHAYILSNTLDHSNV